MLEQMHTAAALHPNTLIPDRDRTVFAELMRLMQTHRAWGGPRRTAHFWHRLTKRPAPEKVRSFYNGAQTHEALDVPAPPIPPKPFLSGSSDRRIQI